MSDEWEGPDADMAEWLGIPRAMARKVIAEIGRARLEERQRCIKICRRAVEWYAAGMIATAKDERDLSTIAHNGAWAAAHEILAALESGEP